MADSFLEDLLPRLANAAPHTHALDFRFEGRHDAAVTLRAPYRAELAGDSATSILASGVVTTLLDHAGGMAVWAALGGFQPIATLDLRIDYMRAAASNADILARAECIQLTRSIAFVRGWAFDVRLEDPVAALQAAYVITSRPDTEIEQ